MIDPNTGNYVPELSIFPHTGVFAGLDVWNALKSGEQAQRAHQLEELETRMKEAQVGTAEDTLANRRAFQEAVTQMPDQGFDPVALSKLSAQYGQPVNPYLSYAKTAMTEAGKTSRLDMSDQAKMERLQKVEEMKTNLMKLHGGQQIAAIRLAKGAEIVDPTTGEVTGYDPEIKRQIDAKVASQDALSNLRSVMAQKDQALLDPMVQQTLARTNLLGSMNQLTQLKSRVLSATAANGGLTAAQVARVKNEVAQRKLAISNAMARINAPTFPPSERDKMMHSLKLASDAVDDLERMADLSQLDQNGKTTLESIIGAQPLAQEETPVGANTSAWHPEADGSFGGAENPTPTHSQTAPGTVPPQKGKADFVFDPTSGSMIPNVPAGSSR